MASSSSSSNYSYALESGADHEVFLSFRGEDTRTTFTAYLYDALLEKGIPTFRDNEGLKVGKPISPALWRAIEEAKMAVVVLSERYADSGWCLDELAGIMRCAEEKGLQVFPVFYHVDPSDVRKQRGKFKDAFDAHAADKERRARVETWKAAMTAVANCRGEHVQDGRLELEYINDIVEAIYSELNNTLPSVSEDLFGMVRRVQEIKSYLELESDGVLFIGIYGMSGIGKTTLARATYDDIRSEFKASSFLNVRAEGLLASQERLLSDMKLLSAGKKWDVQKGTDVLGKRLRCKKVLVVLDEVDESEQLKKLAGNQRWFGPGSRIIMTSTDRQLLVSHGVDKIYPVKRLNDDEALQLFSRKAFKNPNPEPENDLMQIANDFVNYAKGLPLALEVLGSSLCGKKKEVWESARDQLKKVPHVNIMKTLRICFNELEDRKKNLFLDIACFFKGEDRGRVADILESCGYYSESEIDALMDKSLISIVGKKLWMHGLLQEMGQRIAAGEPLEARTRLWRYKDSCDGLMESEEAGAVDGVFEYLPGEKVARCKVDVLSRMKKLKLLRIYDVHVNPGLNYLSNELCLMEWHGYPLKSTPGSFQPLKLVELIMHRSGIEQLWKGNMRLDKLKVIDLSNSHDLIQTPDLGGVKNLQQLILQGCTKLTKVHPSITALKRLNLLNLKGCECLSTFPQKIKLESLKTFNLSGCSSLVEFPEVDPNMRQLSKLYLDGTAIKELPSSFKHLTGLTLLNLANCQNLLCFPTVICTLEFLGTLNLSGCKCQPALSWDSLFRMSEPISLFLPSFSGLSSLESLDLSDCNLLDGSIPDDLNCLSSLRSLNLSSNNFTCLPGCISELSKLKVLYLNKCSMLQSLPYLPLSIKLVMARGCTSLENYSNRFIVWTSGETGFTIIDCLEDAEDEEYQISPISLLDMHLQPLWQKYMEEQIQESDTFYCISGARNEPTEIPEWFIHKSPGSSVPLPLRSDLYSDDKWRGVALYAAFEFQEDASQDLTHFHKLICRLDIDGGPVDKFLAFKIPKDKVPHVGSFRIWLYVSHEIVRDHLDERSCISPEIKSHSPGVNVRMCGARVLFQEDLPEFVENLSHDTFGSPDELRQRHEQFIEFHMNPRHNYHINDAKSSQSSSQQNSIPRLKRELTSLLLRLYQEDCARFHLYDYLFPQSATPLWFHHQNFRSYVRLPLPPNLVYDRAWMGFAVYALYAVNRHSAASSSCDNLNSAISVHFSSLLGAGEDHLSPYIAFPLSRDIFNESHRLLIFYIPGILFHDKLINQHKYIWASFESQNPSVEVQMCGIHILYEHNVEGFVRTLVQCMMTSPPAYHEHYYLNLLQTMEQLRGCDCASSLQRRHQPMPKLLPSIQDVTGEFSPSTSTFLNEAGISRDPSLTRLEFSNHGIEAAAFASTNLSPSSIYLGIPFQNGHCASTLEASGLESWFKTYLENHCEIRGVFNHCFPQREIPGWFSYQSNGSSVAIELPENIFNDPTWMGFAFCAAFSFHKHPTAVRNSLQGTDTGGSHRLICQLTTNLGPMTPLFFHSISEDDVLISLHRRAFIWVSFIPRVLFLSHYWTTLCTWIQFSFLSDGQDSSVLDCGLNLVYQQDMEEFSRTIVRCVTSYVDYLYRIRESSKEESVVYGRLPIYHNDDDNVLNGTCDYSYEKERLVIHELGESSGENVPYCSYEDQATENNQSYKCRFMEFHPSTLYNSCFPPNKIEAWFINWSHGYSVTMEIPPNLYDDNTWMGLAIFATFSYRGDPNAVLKYWLSKIPHYLYCNFESAINAQSQILACRTTKEEIMWLFNLGRFIWVSYVPGQPFSHLINQCRRLEASFASEWPGITVQKCGLRLLYSHDHKQFDQEIIHCNSLISAYRESHCQFMDDYESRIGKKHHDGTGVGRNFYSNEDSEMVILTRGLSGLGMIEVRKSDPLDIDLHSTYSFCFPPREVLKWFTNHCFGHSTEIQLPPNLQSNSNWKGLALCAYFSIHNHQSENTIVNPEISQHLICHLETNVGSLEPPHVHPTTREESFLLHVQGGFIWLSYIPLLSFPEDWLNQNCSHIEASFLSDWPGLVVQKCGLRLLDLDDTKMFEQIIYSCIAVCENRDFLSEAIGSTIDMNEQSNESDQRARSSGSGSSDDPTMLKDKGKKVVEH